MIKIYQQHNPSKMSLVLFCCRKAFKVCKAKGGIEQLEAEERDWQLNGKARWPRAHHVLEDLQEIQRTAGAGNQSWWRQAAMLVMAGLQMYSFNMFMPFRFIPFAGTAGGFFGSATPSSSGGLVGSPASGPCKIQK